jgi:A/G-specific adenine glycosylase
MNKKTTTTLRAKNNKALTLAQVRAFQKVIYGHYDTRGRDLPWRKKLNPYRVLVSEIMLQQTQVERVIEKFHEFLEAFPDFNALAHAPLPRLLKIAAFAFNRPVVFMDTNIRRVYIHEFFHDRDDIHDDEIIPFLERTMDAEHPGKWYNALMDYGTMLKKEHVNPNRRSAHYSRQSPFENSNRQVRGRILNVLVKEAPLTQTQIVLRSGMDRERVKQNLAQLMEEGFIKKKGRSFAL